MQAFIHRADVGQRAEYIRAAGAIQSTGDFWDLYFHCEGKFLKPFSIPGVLSKSEFVEPLSSPQAMESEALRMRNCLANRISRVQAGSRIFFRLRDGSPVNAELVRRGQKWFPGAVLGQLNSRIEKKLKQQIKNELRRLAKMTINTPHSIEAEKEDAFVAKMRRDARDLFPAEYIAELTTPLQSIQAKTRSWDEGAYTIFNIKRGGYVQFMSSPDGKEYLIEISSHKYDEKINDLLTSNVVEMIEKAGFVWPSGQSNFLRWFNISSPDDIRAMAEITLAILARMFRFRKMGSLKVITNIPF